MRGICGTLATGLLLLACCPVGADAASVRTHSTFGTSEIELSADPGEANDLSLSRAGRLVEIRFTQAPLEPGKGCRSGGPALVRCKPAKPKNLNIPGFPGGHAFVFPDSLSLDLKLGDRDDRIDATALPATFPLETGRVDMELIANGGEGIDSIASGSGNDGLAGGPGDDVIDAGPGDDAMEAGREGDGTDVLRGGPGHDMADYLRRREPLVLSLDDIANDGTAGEGDDVSSAELLAGGLGDDLMVGDDGRNGLLGFGGDDSLVGAGGRDYLLGDFGEVRGDDRLDGGAGADGLVGGAGRDAFLAGAGADNVEAAGTDESGSPDERDRVDCASGRDDARAQRKDVLIACERVRIVRPDRRRRGSAPARVLRDRRLHGLVHLLGEQGVGVLAAGLGRRHP